MTTVKEKAIAMIKAGKSVELNGRKEKAIALIESDGIIRIGRAEQGYHEVFWVPSSFTYTDSISAAERCYPDAPPFYRVGISTDAEHAGHICECADFAYTDQHGWQTGQKRGAPRIGKNIICKHILAAWAISLARQRLGFSLELEEQLNRVAKAEREERRAKDALASEEKLLQAQNNMLCQQRVDMARENLSKAQTKTAANRAKAEEIRQKAHYICHPEQFVQDVQKAA
jgi:hypothetical protein